jgi:hypothetical protein
MGLNTYIHPTICNATKKAVINFLLRSVASGNYQKMINYYSTARFYEIGIDDLIVTGFGF